MDMSSINYVQHGSPTAFPARAAARGAMKCSMVVFADIG
jgi:hypothetical protein